MSQGVIARLPPPGIPASAIDPFSLDFLRDPHPAHEALRETGPVVWLAKYGCYAVARHAEVRRMLDDPATFCSGRGVGLSDFQREKPWRPPSLVLERDPPEHDRARAVLNRALSATVIRSLRGRFAEAADKLALNLARKGRFDAIADCAEVYPMMVLPDAVGLSRQGREHLLPYAATVFNMFGPDNELRRMAVAQMAPHVEWITAQCKREALTDDGIGAMIHAGADAGEVTREEAELLVRSLLSAGFDTTVHGLGAALRALAHSPDQFAALRADPTKARASFEEALRLETPVQTFFRTTTRDAELGGVTIGEGEKVLMLLGAANRDPRRWPKPDRYDIDRQTAGHVAFGAGVHMCVGQLLARLEGETLLAALARALARIEPDGEPTPLLNNTLRGWTRLPIRVTAA
jgi:4-methoxybenzoate monooxygenase (O-demethylating)